MTAKKKSDDTSKKTGNAIDPELEKKVDAMMSVEQPATPEDTSTEVAQPDPPATEEIASAPLLPTEKIPVLDKKPEPPKISPPPEPRPVAPTEAEAPQPVSPRAPMPDDLRDELGLEDAGTSKAVDDIVASESDELLQIHDDEARSRQTSIENTPKKKKSLLKRWWQNRWARNLTILALLLGIAAAAVIPVSRYFVLNAAGVRVAASMTVLDETTGQPLKNAQVIVGDQSAKTDEEGNVRLDRLKLGSAELKITKPAFADITKEHVFGWGSNPLGEFRLKAVGSQYKFVLTDFLSKKPITKATATSGEASAKANDKGEVILTVPQTENEQIEVEITADSYRTEKQKVTISTTKEVALAMVPARKHVFITKRSGTYDVYKSDVDGKNEEKILSGTGGERTDSMALAVHPTKNLAALVSTRDNSKMINGMPVNTLTLINVAEGTNKTISQSERIQIIDWIGDRLIYVKIGENEKNDSTTRHRLISYDLESEEEKELASTNYFNAVIAVKNNIYYTPAAFNVNGSVGLFKIGANGENKKTIFDKEVWSLFRTSYDKLSVSIGQEWYDLNLTTDTMTAAGAAPANQKSRIYVESPTGSPALWVDDRDGKGTLLAYDPQATTEKILHQKSGLKYPVYWLDATHIVFRVSTNQETADYIFSTDGGVPTKIHDVTDTAGVDRWYYY